MVIGSKTLNALEIYNQAQSEGPVLRRFRLLENNDNNKINIVKFRVFEQKQKSAVKPKPEGG